MEEIRELLKRMNKRLDQIEFRQGLLFRNSSVDRILYEYNITENEYNLIMDEMDRLRSKIDSGSKVDNSEFENNIYNILGGRENIDYHFCEDISMAFMDEGRWEEVFPAIYGDMPKYRYLKEDKK